MESKTNFLHLVIQTKTKQILYLSFNQNNIQTKQQLNQNFPLIQKHFKARQCLRLQPNQQQEKKIQFTQPTINETMMNKERDLRE